MFRLPACLSFPTLRATLLVLVAADLTASGDVLYETGFETTDTPPFTAGTGTVTTPKLVGTGNWTMSVSPSTISTNTCYPFAGIDSNMVPGMGQTAALGCLDHINYTMPPSTTQFIRVGRKVTSEPVVAGNMPIVEFYCQLGLNQSTNSRYDDFELLFYNWDDKVLGGLTFDLTKSKLFRYDANEYNTGSSDSPYTDTGLSLTSLYGSVLEVTMRVNYRTNTWTATINGVPVISNATFTRRPTTGTNAAARTFGSAQARWYVTLVGYPGNNWMLFDAWNISAGIEPTIPATASAGYAANSTASITVTDTSSIGWTASSDQSWAVVSPATSSGTGTLTVTCAANPNTTTRTANITVGAQTCVLTQAAAPGVTIPSTANASYGANSLAAIPVTANTTWNASSNQTWAVVSPASGNGNGTVTATCALNPAAATRSATITVGTQTCVLTQAASPYAVWAASLTDGSRDFATDADHDGVINGLEYALGRNAASSSGVNGISQLPVITASGSGATRHLVMSLNLPEPAPVDIVYDVQASNNLTGSWTNIMEKNGTAQWTALGGSGATMSSSTASGRTLFTITDAQGYHFMRLAVSSSSVPAPVTSIPASAASLYTAGSTASIQVTSTGAWTATSDQSWAVVSPATGNGSGTVTVTCAANAGLARTATISIGGQTCVLTQAAAPYALWAAALPAGKQGFYQDADGDGVANGMEYALGRSATDPAGDNGTAQLPTFAWTGSGASRHPAIAINLPNTVAADMTYAVQASNSLTGTWTTLMEKSGNNAWIVIGASGATASSAAAGTGRTLHTVTDTQSHHFLRLQITKTP